MIKVSAIVPAAGSGIRLKSKVAKPLVVLNGKPLLWYTLRALEASPRITDIIVVAEKKLTGRIEKMLKKFRFKKIKAVTAGGSTRSESVSNGLACVEEDADFILIHDGARPFLSFSIIERCLKQALKKKAVVTAVPCTSTIKKVDSNHKIISTLERDLLWEVQTPQVFAAELLRRAYINFKKEGRGYFDDASLVEKLSHNVHVAPGARTNIKITTQDDLKLAKAILKTVNRV